MADFGVNVKLKIDTSKKDLEAQIKEKLGEGLDIGAKLIVDPKSIETLDKSLKDALAQKTYTVNIGNVKLLDSAKVEMKKQIEQMFGYSTRETTLETKELQKQVELLQKKAAASEAVAKKTEEELKKQRESLKQSQEQAIALRNQKDLLTETYNAAKKLVSASKSTDLSSELSVYKQLMNEVSVQKQLLSNTELNERIASMQELGQRAQAMIDFEKQMAQAARENAQAQEEAERAADERAKLMEQLSNTYNRLLIAEERFRTSEISRDERTGPMKEQYAALKKSIEEVMHTSGEFTNEYLEDLLKQSRALITNENALRSESNALMQRNNLMRQAHTLYQQMNSLLSNSPKLAAGDLGGEIKTLMSGLNNRITAGDISPEYLNQVRTQLSQLTSAGKTLNLMGKESDTIFKQLFSRFTAVGVITIAFQKIIGVCREMLSNVKELDAAMTELRKVTTETEAGYEKFFVNAGARAHELGATMADVINATADFARLGYSIDDAATLADVATIYKNVGDGITSIDAAAESVISTMKAFGIEAEDAMSIVDKFNEIGRNCCRAA